MAEYLYGLIRDATIPLAKGDVFVGVQFERCAFDETALIAPEDKVLVAECVFVDTPEISKDKLEAPPEK